MTLLIFNDEIFEDTDLSGIKAELFGVELHSFQERAIRRNRIDDVDKALFEREHVQQITVLQRRINSSLERVREHVDRLEMPLKCIVA